MTQPNDIVARLDHWDEIATLRAKIAEMDCLADWKADANHRSHLLSIARTKALKEAMRACRNLPDPSTVNDCIAAIRELKDKGHE